MKVPPRLAPMIQASQSNLATYFRTKFHWWHETILATLLLGLLVYAKIVDPSFLSLSNQLELSKETWEAALISLAMLLVIITGGIDLSVGSMVALSAVVLGLCYKAGVPIWVAAVIAVACGTFLGAVNGWFVSKLKVHPLIVTLATLAAYRGAAEGISLAKPTSEFPAAFLSFGQGAWLGVPYAGYIFVVLFGVLAVVLAKTAFGRALFTIGHNEKAARFSGIHVARVKLAIYALSGTMCGLAAALMVARLDTAKADFANGMELQVITAVVLGGANINGGRGNVVGLLLGIVLLHETNRFIEFHWMQNELKLVVGALLIISVLVHRMLTPRATQEDT